MRLCPSVLHSVRSRSVSAAGTLADLNWFMSLAFYLKYCFAKIINSSDLIILERQTDRQTITVYSELRSQYDMSKLHITYIKGMYGLFKLVGWLCWGLTSQSTIFQSCRDGAIASWVINQYFRGVKCLAQGHNTAAVGLEPRTSRSGVRHSTTEPPRSPFIQVHLYIQTYEIQSNLFMQNEYQGSYIHNIIKRITDNW